MVLRHFSDSIMTDLRQRANSFININMHENIYHL